MCNERFISWQSEAFRERPLVINWMRHSLIVVHVLLNVQYFHLFHCQTMLVINEIKSMECTGLTALRDLSRPRPLDTFSVTTGAAVHQEIAVALVCHPMQFFLVPIGFVDFFIELTVWNWTVGFPWNSEDLAIERPSGEPALTFKWSKCIWRSLEFSLKCYLLRERRISSGRRMWWGLVPFWLEVQMVMLYSQTKGVKHKYILYISGLVAYRQYIHERSSL